MRDLFEAAASAHQRGDLRAAEDGYRRVIESAPNFHPAWNGLGMLAHQARQYSTAADLFGRAASLDPNAPSYLSNLGSALAAAGRLQSAAQAFRRACSLAPNQSSIYNNLGNTLQRLGEIDEATEALEHARRLSPDHPWILNNLGNLYKEQGRFDEAIAAYELAAEERNFTAARSNLLAALKLSTKHTAEQIFALHLRFGHMLQASRSENYLPLANTADPTRRLTIGYVSPDCHPAIPAFIYPVIRAHNAHHFRIICYYNNPQPDLAGAELHIETRVMAGLSDDQVSKMVRADGVDILVDIAGHTGINRLGVFATRSAPIQVTWLDYLSTTGLESMDYRITDQVADPMGLTEHLYTEQLWRLPHTQWCWQPPAGLNPPAPVPAIANRCITFGSFNNYSKLTDATLFLWRELLSQLPYARLIVVGAAPGHCQERVRAALKVSCERLEFAPRVRESEYRALYSKVDIALDPIPFSGATTTLDALWEGVPVITLSGPFSWSRSSASILSCLSLDNWIAQSEIDYLRIAQSRALQMDELTQLRKELRQRLQCSPLTDATRFVSALESGFREMWHRWCEVRALSTLDGRSVLSDRRFFQRELDLKYFEAKRYLHGGESERGIRSLIDILRRKQNWRIAQSELAHASLHWARTHPEIVRKQFPLADAGPCAESRVSIIVCSIDSTKYERVCTNLRDRFGDRLIEIIGIHDAKSLCEGYNRGASKAVGETLVFCHDDIEIVTPDFADRMLSHLSKFDGVGICGTTRLIDGNWGSAGQPWIHGQIIHQRPPECHNILLVNGCAEHVIERAQAYDGVFFAVRRQVWETLRFDEETFDGFHLYDIDFTFRAFLAGFNLAIAADLLLIHHSTGNYDKEWKRYNRRFLKKFTGKLAQSVESDAGALNCKLQVLEQTDLLLAALHYFRYGS